MTVVAHRHGKHVHFMSCRICKWSRAGELTLGLGEITLLNTSLDGLVELVVEDGRGRVVKVIVVLNIFLDGLATIAKVVLAVRFIAIEGRGWSLVQRHRPPRTENTKEKIFKKHTCYHFALSTIRKRKGKSQRPTRK